MKYWTTGDTRSIIKYINAPTQKEKNQIFTQELYPVIKKNCEAVIYSYNNSVDEDQLTDLIVHIYQKVLPKIQLEKVQASQNIIWIAASRKLFTDYRANYNYNSTTTLVDNYSAYTSTTSDSSSEFEAAEQQQITRHQILSRIDELLEKQQIMNKTNSVFLQLLRDYAITNNYQVHNFREYCCQTMGINVPTFWNICSSLGIRSKVFHEKISKKYL